MATRTRRTRTTEETAPEAVVPPVEETQTEEVIPVADVVDDVVTETETAEPAKRGRKADPTTAALKRFKEAKSELEKSRQAQPLDVAQAEHDAAKAALLELMDSE